MHNALVICIITIIIISNNSHPDVSALPSLVPFHPNLAISGVTLHGTSPLSQELITLPPLLPMPSWPRTTNARQPNRHRLFHYWVHQLTYPNLISLRGLSRPLELTPPLVQSQMAMAIGIIGYLTCYCHSAWV
ncbi:hypothetical protein BDZ91DRAFT_718234 [Kalaharituber pfeilii]|nr:hypothetical protein BDZ91DRAFT_718234 [Kalaharituber pfeilii]